MRTAGLVLASALALPARASASAPPPPGGSPEANADEPADANANANADARARVPRIDGPYLGFAVVGTATLTRVSRLDTPGPFAGAGGHVRFGQMVLPWLGLGLSVGGSFGTRTQDGARQQVWLAELLVDGTFVPVPRIPLSLRASFGFGGGAVRQADFAKRSGFGGAVFGAAIRYEFFPGVKRYRPTRGGGFGLGPELGWVGATPAARGRPMAHVLYLGVAGTFYFGS